jgi:branched-chain amino acid transport system ATP-binding protein
VDFEVAEGECVALIGPNGAGKSTCFACIAGQQVPTAGQVLWQGQSLLGLQPRERLARGVARTFQVAQIFEALSVQQNLQLALQASQGQWSALQPLSACHLPQAQALLAQAGLEGVAEHEAASLPYGAKKRLELALALAAGPRLLLLDEPAAGLAGQERQGLMQWVRQLANEGLTVLYTEHNMDAVAGLADRVLVLIEGRLAAQGSFAQIARDPVVQARYLGHSGLDFLDPKEPPHA